MVFMVPRQKVRLIKDRYSILNILGQGGCGTTYEAKDQVSGDHVALKELSLQNLNDWKTLELFEREAQVLKELEHPAIPRYIDYFQVDTDNNRYFYIVQELVRGNSLAKLVAAGQKFSEAETRHIATEILKILEYLHGLTPPIIHRDIKPHNIIYGDNNIIFLVDFGAVQTVYHNTVAFSTNVVGTYGYMAPEQFCGQAHPTTDLYGLGTTLINLLSHQEPGDLPQKRLKLDFRSAVNISDEFTIWLEGLIEPLVEDRFPSASTALTALSNPYYLLNDNASKRRQLIARTRVQLNRSYQHLSIKIPSTDLFLETIGDILFILLIVAFLSLWPYYTTLAGQPLIYRIFLYTCGIIGGAWIIHSSPIKPLLESLSIEIGQDYFSFKYQILFWKNVRKGKTEDLEVLPIKGRNRVKKLVLQEGIHSHVFGISLTRQETEWLLTELNDFIQRQKQLNHR